ncbi:uncharacterized protein LOC129910978 [Episyrphus balteatus]|uniref:uncharacterized protein LOC129910978 n=1 Tax=Episyrphus balteatus TaxID=286459 RepID=UPI00248635B6|nr:uncharacterized protein LOC129910978 [Episyrphus balteatus]
MDQFSHDLTIALEETSRMGGVRVGRWGQRRRTRSTGNLPCAPQPTEDSSSSPTDAANGAHNKANVDGLDGLNNSIHSDSDDRQEMRLAINPRLHTGNLESDSLNENFSPARFFRPSTRRKRKFKRMAVEYETTAAKTPTVSGGLHSSTIDNSPEFTLTGTVKKRALRHAIQDSYRANLFFCGKRKRSHRDRCHDHEHGKAHSSSVPRQSHMFPVKHSLQEHKSRTRSFSSTSKVPCDRILPLNKGLISKIEKISQQQQKNQQDSHATPPKCAFLFTPLSPVATTTTATSVVVPRKLETSTFDSFASITAAAAVATCSTGLSCEILTNRFMQQTIPEHYALKQQIMTSVRNDLKNETTTARGTIAPSQAVPVPGAYGLSFSQRKKKYYRLRREQMKMQLQFEDPNSMECGELNEFLSSSSLSSSESENERTNDSDREGDDELTDWPGNEVINNFDSKNDFKRKLTKKSGNLQQIKSDENATIGDDDTLMSADELDTPVNSVHRHMSSAPIAINKGLQLNGGVSNLLSQKSFTLRDETMDQFRFPIRQIESEMSGETSNPFLASPPCKPGEIREIRAGCRRIKGERAAFSIKTSVNERLARFLQDARQTHIRLPDIEFYEHESLMNLAKLYSLQMSVDNGCAVLTKTSNTTQSVQIDHHGLQNCLFLSDFKRRCYDGRFGITDADEDSTIAEAAVKFAKAGQSPPPEISNRLPNS